MSAAADAAFDPAPQPPREPEAWECCQSGCDPCIYDRYWDAYARYEEALARWQARRRPGCPPKPPEDNQPFE